YSDITRARMPNPPKLPSPPSYCTADSPQLRSQPLPLDAGCHSRKTSPGPSPAPPQGFPIPDQTQPESQRQNGDQSPRADRAAKRHPAVIIPRHRTGGAEACRQKCGRTATSSIHPQCVDQPLALPQAALSHVHPNPESQPRFPPQTLKVVHEHRIRSPVRLWDALNRLAMMAEINELELEELQREFCVT